MDPVLNYCKKMAVFNNSGRFIWDIMKTHLHNCGVLCVRVCVCEDILSGVLVLLSQQICNQYTSKPEQ